jgi:3-(3-hydroxy-phenyl)propionate hydroxylase
MLRPGESRDVMERDDTIRRLLAPWARADALEIERKAVYRFHARSCTHYRRGRVFLAGDAAHVTPPFTGQGLVGGLRDAANLAWKLAWVVYGRADARILDSYDQERRPHARRMIALATVMGRAIMPRSRIAAVLIHGAMKVARRLPIAHRYLEELGLKPAPRFTLCVGRRRGVLPQRRVRNPDGALVRSDDVIGPGLALVSDVALCLAPDTRRRWRALGGTSLRQRNVLARRGWCAIVRPDRAILHEGPASDADRIVREAIALLAG